MKQTTFASTGFELVTKRTRKREFLEEMNLVVPWTELTGLIPRVRHQMTQVIVLYRASFKLATTKGSIERFALVFSGSNSPALWLACR